jgi:hypothetical protein
MKKYQIYNREWRLKNKERIRENNRKWRLANPDKVKEAKHRDYVKNKERYIKLSVESIKRRKEKNPDLFFQKQREKISKYSKTPKGIYKVLLGRTLKKKYNSIIDKEEFIKWYKGEVKKCSYCDIPEEKLYLIKEKKGKLRFSIDRKDNNKGYIRGNICLACFTCNRTKGETFSPDVMKRLAIKFIKPIWKTQIQKN